MTTTTKKIARIITVMDTREYVEEGDRFVPLPGSGIANECHRCGRLHEVHATVELADGSTATVGTGCMTADDFDGGAKLVRSAASTARTVAKLLGEVTALSEGIARAKEVRAEVEAIPAPPVTLATQGEGRDARTVGTMGDAKVWAFEAWDEEREHCLLELWRDNRARERGGLCGCILRNRQAKLADLLERVKRTEERLAAKLAA